MSDVKVQRHDSAKGNTFQKLRTQVDTTDLQEYSNHRPDPGTSEVQEEPCTKPASQAMTSFQNLVLVRECVRLILDCVCMCERYKRVNYVNY